MNNFFVDLQHQDLLRVHGQDAARFLQGQVSCDINTLDTRPTSLGTICNTKGRIISAFRILRSGNDYFMRFPPGMGALSQAHLGKFMVFYKAEIDDARDMFQRIGCVGESGQQILENVFGPLPTPGQAHVHEAGHIFITHPRIGQQAPRHECWLQPESADGGPLLEQLRSTLPEGSETDWQLEDIRSGLLLPGEEQSERYTPQELNLDLSDAVSFSKGCYTGQEVVARMHYRGKGSKRLHAFKSTEPASNFSQADLPGLTLVDRVTPGSGGEIVTALLNREGTLEGLAILKSDHLPTEPAAALADDTGTMITLELHALNDTLPPQS